MRGVEREIAVRLALGAEPAGIRRMVIGRGLRLVSVGLVAGVAVSYGVARLLASFLYQTQSHDLVTFAAVPVVLLVVGLIACALPAYRASTKQSETHRPTSNPWSTGWTSSCCAKRASYVMSSGTNTALRCQSGRKPDFRPLLAERVFENP